jgi:hypothetical protein
MHNLTVSNVCLVAEAVEVGLVGVAVGVSVMVGEDVAVGVSGVAVVVGDEAIVGVVVGVSSDGFMRGMKIKASSRTSPMTDGIPYF